MSQSQISNQRSATLAPHASAGVSDPLRLMVGVLLLAAAFRFLAIDAAPPGWRDDELIEFGMDQRIAQGWRPLFITEAEGHEPFYHYLHAGTLLLFGENIVGYKWQPFAFGLMTVALTFALAKRLFDVRVALLTAALMAVSFWPIMYSRLGLRHIGLLPLMLGAFYLLYPSLRPSPQRGEGAGFPRPFRERVKGEGRVLLAGVCLAAALMTYFAGRAVPVVLIGFLAYLLIFNRSILRKAWPLTMAAIVIAVALAAPMFIQIANTPGAEKRTEVVGGPLIAAQHGNLKPAIDTTFDTLGMFTFAGDPESLYNVSGRPVFDWLTGIFFYVGVLLCLVRLKRVESGFALTWLLVGIAPAFVSLPAASFSHTLAAQPVIYMIAAYGVVEGVGKVRSRQGGRAALSTAFLVSLFVIGTGAYLTLRDYFGTWANDPFVRFQYHAPTRDIAQWLNQNPAVTDVAIGTNPNELVLDPVALKLDLRRQDVKARWFNPAAIFLMPVDGYVILSSMQSAGGFGDYALSPETKLLADSPDAVVAYHQVTGSLIAIQGEAEGMGLISTQPKLKPYHPGDKVTLQTNWQIRKPISAPKLKSFAHIIGKNNELITGVDREDIDVASLYAGDIFCQYNELNIPKDVAPGQYQVEVGWYNPETGVRLKRADGSDRFLLDPIEVTAP